MRRRSAGTAAAIQRYGQRLPISRSGGLCTPLAHRAATHLPRSIGPRHPAICYNHGFFSSPNGTPRMEIGRADILIALLVLAAVVLVANFSDRQPSFRP